MRISDWSSDVCSSDLVRGLAAAGLAIAGTTVVMLLSLTTRPPTIDRLTSESAADDLRFSALPYIWQMALDAFPFGWGAGSFVTASKVVEPDPLLSHNYLNHAPNHLLTNSTTFAAFLLCS